MNNDRRKFDANAQATRNHQEFERHKLDDIHDSINEFKKDFSEFKEQARPVIEWFAGISFLKSTAKWVVGFLIALGTLILTLRQIFRE